VTTLDLPLVLPWLAFAASWALLGAVAVLVHRLVRRPLARLAAPQRSVLLLALALLPSIGAAFVALLGFAPQIGGLAVGTHCHAGSGCGPHVPMLQASVIEAVILGALLIWISAGIVWRLARRLRRSLALADTLDAFAARNEHNDYAVVDSREPFAYCLGLWRPRLVVSRGLLTQLPAAERSAVLAHERAHAARRDNLRQWLAAVSLWPLPQRWRRALMTDLTAANEQSCDAVAVEVAGPAVVAAAVSSLTASGPTTNDRLAALTARATDWPPTATLAVIVVVYTACTLPTLDAVHFGLELVVRWLG